SPHDHRDPSREHNAATEPFVTDDQLRQRWRSLVGQPHFADHELWFVFVEDGKRQMLPLLNRIGLPIRPERGVVELLMTRLSEISIDGPDVSVAFLLTRPGTDGLSDTDLTWARIFGDAADRHGVAIHPIHRANKADLVRVPRSLPHAA
ncbi:hypothetical protein QSJ18_06820, partial [Gordonia sp. ABSL1-1]|uniref:hypothetical protein n=1 Tax=Gordonia sp. ABSL1-1 TaxID=3053923 RepID=UPI002573B69C